MSKQFIPNIATYGPGPVLSDASRAAGDKGGYHRKLRQAEGKLWRTVPPKILKSFRTTRLVMLKPNRQAGTTQPGHCLMEHHALYGDMRKMLVILRMRLGTRNWLKARDRTERTKWSCQRVNACRRGSWADGDERHFFSRVIFRMLKQEIVAFSCRSYRALERNREITKKKNFLEASPIHRQQCRWGGKRMRWGVCVPSCPVRKNCEALEISPLMAIFKLFSRVLTHECDCTRVGVYIGAETEEEYHDDNATDVTWSRRLWPIYESNF